MPTAAVPAYLKQYLDKKESFESASPGMRFGMYLPIWTEQSDQERYVHSRTNRGSDEARAIEAAHQQGGIRGALAHIEQRGTRIDQVWGKTTSAASQAWRNVVGLSAMDRALNDALAVRTDALSNLVATRRTELLRFDAVAIAPFTTGLGNEHPLENGFAFLNPYGLPYLAGSGVKGVLREAARELAENQWGDVHGWSREPLEVTIGKTLKQADILFGRESADHDTEMFRGVLTFWDVIPQIADDKLLIEVMTPHQSHYYQNGEDPHDSGQPNPINFLTVPPGSRFSFNVLCDFPRLQQLAPSLARDDRWKTLLEAAFAHAFEWLGFGAKTAVGYGAMRLLSASEVEKRRAESAQAALRCSWVDETIEGLVKQNRAKKEEVLRGKQLAEAWKALTDASLKQKALVDIKSRWMSEGWWDAPPGKAAKQAKAIYDEQ